jgi:hypothetical protein
MMPRELIGVPRCGGKVFPACARCGHILLRAYDVCRGSAGGAGILTHQTSTVAGSEITQAEGRQRERLLGAGRREWSYTGIQL